MLVPEGVTGRCMMIPLFRKYIVIVCARRGVLVDRGKMETEDNESCVDQGGKRVLSRAKLFLPRWKLGR